MATYEVKVFTGDVDGAGTDANVYIVLYGQQRHTHPFLLDNPDRNDFERGHRDVFVLRNVPDDLGDLNGIAIWHDGSEYYSAWFLDGVNVLMPGTDKLWRFGLRRWLEGGVNDKCVGVYIPVEGEYKCILKSNTPSNSRGDDVKTFFKDLGSVLSVVGEIAAAE